MHLGFLTRKRSGNHQAERKKEEIRPHRPKPDEQKGMPQWHSISTIMIGLQENEMSADRENGRRGNKRHSIGTVQ
jgi:hypothetical protein